MIYKKYLFFILFLFELVIDYSFGLRCERASVFDLIKDNDQNVGIDVVNCTKKNSFCFAYVYRDDVYIHRRGVSSGCTTYCFGEFKENCQYNKYQREMFCCCKTDVCNSKLQYLGK